MENSYPFAAARAAHPLRRALTGAALLLLALLPWAARAQGPTVTVTPAGPLTLCAGRTQTLTATATVPGFNVAGTGFNGPVYAVLVQADGKVLVGGNFTAYNGNTAAPDYLLRLNADGSLDAGFNAGGAGTNNVVVALAVQADGKVLAGGNFTAYNGSATASDYVLRLNADGSRDAGFNAGGAGTDNTVSALAVQADGKVLVGGRFTAYNGSAAAPDRVLRLNADGSLDAGFNAGGAGTDFEVRELAVQAGKVLIGGFFFAYNGNAAAPDNLLRLNADGSLDAGFDAGGAGVNNTVLALAVQADGKVLIGGVFSAYNGNAAPDNLLRLNADGSLDAGFNAGGAGTDNTVSALAVQADGKVLVGGYFTDYNGNAAAPDRVLRLNADGSLDAGFNAGGAGANSQVDALAVQADGKVLAGGNFTAYNGNAAAPDYLLRLNADGSLDAGTPLATLGSRVAPAVQLYPNPARTTATITGARPGAPVQVLDVLGQLVLTAPADARGQASLLLPAGLPAGVYLVRTGTQAVRLIVE